MHIFHLFLILGALSFTGCRSNINVDYNPEIDFYAFSEYKFVKPQPELEKQLYYSRIKNSIIEALSHKGMLEVSENENVHIRFLVTKKTRYQSVSTGAGYSYRRYSGMGMTSTHVFEIPQAMLMIEFINPKTREIMWQGSKTVDVKEKASPQERQALVTRVVNEILSEYPPNNHGGF